MTIDSGSEFLALCHAQVKLLTKSLNASWAVIYLTEDFWHSYGEKLNPIVVYPANKKFWEQDYSPLLSPQKQSYNQLFSLPWDNSFSHGYVAENFDSMAYHDVADFTSQGKMRKLSDFQEGKQAMLPLIYQDSVMGLLITGRNDRQWNDLELDQIKNIVDTLAIACFLDQRQDWYKKQLILQQKVTLQQQDHLDTLLHQLKNPITALRTFGKLLLKRFLPENPNYDIIQGIFQESNRLQELVENFQGETNTQYQSILSLPPQNNPSTTSFLLTGNTLNLQPLFLAEILNPLIFSFQAIAQEKEIKINHNFVTYNNQLAPIKGDLQALREVFSNLIDNALKYTPPKGSVFLELGLKKTIDNQEYQGIGIHDNGYGIPSEDQAHIFERHYRGEKENSDINGSGLGLAIVKELVEQMGGYISIFSPNLYFKSSHLSGTTVIIWLVNSP
jgi:signal transduction histidine kinase